LERDSPKYIVVVLELMIFIYPETILDSILAMHMNVSTTATYSTSPRASTPVNPSTFKSRSINQHDTGLPFANTLFVVPHLSKYLLNG
jgi:hypothetical protein